MDWAFGTLARWNAARLMEAANLRGHETCVAWTNVARLWKYGDARYRARADAARQRVAALRCPTT